MHRNEIDPPLARALDVVQLVDHLGEVSGEFLMVAPAHVRRLDFLGRNPSQSKISNDGACGAMVSRHFHGGYWPNTSRNRFEAHPSAFAEFFERVYPRSSA
jgi:hypothetical protein